MTAALLDGLSSAAAELFTRSLEPLHVRRGEPVFSQGDPGDCLFLIRSGKVKLTRRAGPEGRELLALTGPGDVFGELSLFDPGPRTTTATPLTDAHLGRLGHEHFRAWLTVHPEATGPLLRELARRLQRTDDALTDLVFTDVPGRVAKALLGLAARFGVDEGGRLRVTHDLTQDELAQLVGASRETVNKALADFAARGWISVAWRTVVVLDEQRLRQRAR